LWYSAFFALSSCASSMRRAASYARFSAFFCAADFGAARRARPAHARSQYRGIPAFRARLTAPVGLSDSFPQWAHVIFISSVVLVVVVDRGALSPLDVWINLSSVGAENVAHLQVRLRQVGVLVRALPPRGRQRPPHGGRQPRPQAKQDAPPKPCPVLGWRPLWTQRVPQFSPPLLPGHLRQARFDKGIEHAAGRSRACARVGPCGPCGSTKAKTTPRNREASCEQPHSFSALDGW